MAGTAKPRSTRMRTRPATDLPARTCHPADGTPRSASTCSTGMTSAPATIRTPWRSTLPATCSVTPARCAIGIRRCPPARRVTRRRWCNPPTVRLRGQATPRFLHGRQRVLGLGKGARPHIHARGLRGDRDLLAGGRIAAGALLGRGLHANGQLDDAPDPDLLGVAELLEHDLLEGLDRPLGFGLAHVC